MRKKVMYIGIIVVAIIIAVVIVMLANPLRRSEERIRDSILRITPIGMSMEDVLNIIEDNGRWEIRHIFDQGYIVGRWGVRGPHQGYFISGHDVAIVGVASLEVHIGSYNFLFFFLEERVSVFFGFDKDSKLVDIGIRKYAIDTF